MHRIRLSFTFAYISCWALFGSLSLNSQTLPGNFTTLPFKSVPDAGVSAAAQITIPYFTLSTTAPKDGRNYVSFLAGGSPSSGTTTTTDVVVVPVRFNIFQDEYDPLTANICDGNFSAQVRLQGSPLVQPQPRNYINGVNVGSAQYIDAFRRAEFWGNSQTTKNPINFTYAPEVIIGPEIVGTHGFSFSSGCNLLGVVSINWLDNYLFKTVMPDLTARGIISPTKLALFLYSNIVQSGSDPPTLNNCCVLGYHSAFGNSSFIQTYGATVWNTTSLFGTGLLDASIASHELAEWFDDPFVNNPTPPWGNIGQVSGCQGNLEVGDPLTGTSLPPVISYGYPYHLQELAFFGWFFDSSAKALSGLGTGGAYSTNGKFTGPSRACPPGGTFN
jgi:hypothetical protein